VARRLLVLPLLAGLLFLPGCFWWLAPMAAVGSEESESGSGTATYEPDDGMTAVRASIPAIEAYYADNGTYKGATLQVLKERYDYGLSDVEIVKANDKTYCVQSTTDDFPWFKAGPAADVAPGNCGNALGQLPPPTTDAESCVEWSIDGGGTYYSVGKSEPAPGHCP
jgi:hypothetical protein